MSTVSDSTLNDCTCVAQGCALVLENNTIHETALSTTGDWSDAHEIVLKKNTIRTGKECLVTVGNSYKQIILHGNTIQATHPHFTVVHLSNPIKSKTRFVEFLDNTITGNGGLVLKLDRLPGAECTLTINWAGSSLNTIGKWSDNVAKAANVKITEK